MHFLAFFVTVSHRYIDGKQRRSRSNRQRISTENSDNVEENDADGIGGCAMD
jgi:hypothetical protein